MIYDINNWEDPVMQEIHRMREEHAKKFNYDIRAMSDDSSARGRALYEEWMREKQKRTKKEESQAHSVDH